MNKFTSIVQEQQYVRTALGMWSGGASNPIAIVNFLKRYVDAYKDELSSTELSKSVPMRLALAQLSSLAGIGIGDCAGADDEAEVILSQDLSSFLPQSEYTVQL